MWGRLAAGGRLAVGLSAACALPKFVMPIVARPAGKGTLVLAASTRVCSVETRLDDFPPSTPAPAATFLFLSAFTGVYPRQSSASFSAWPAPAPPAPEPTPPWRLQVGQTIAICRLSFPLPRGQPGRLQNTIHTNGFGARLTPELPTAVIANIVNPRTLEKRGAGAPLGLLVFPRSP
jgi:hypothetical protein